MNMSIDDALLFEQLEMEDLPTSMYEKRVVELKKYCDDNAKLNQHQCGQYTQIMNDEAVLKLTTTLDKVVLHFRHDDFKRCLEMDNHMIYLSKKYPKIKFGYCNVLSCPFIVTRFNIRVLPHLVVFENNIAKKHFIGFEEFGVHNVEVKHVEFELLDVFNMLPNK